MGKWKIEYIYPDRQVNKSRKILVWTFIGIFTIMFYTVPTYVRGEEPYIHKIPEAKLKTIKNKREKEIGLIEALIKSFKPDLSRFQREPTSTCHAVAEEFSINVGFSSSLKKVKQKKTSGGDEYARIYKQLFTETLSFNPFPPYYARITFFQYLRDEYQQDYEPDFSYSFGIANYAPHSFSLEYSNFGGNRLNPNKEKGEKFTDFEAGTITGTYRYILPKWLTRILHPGKNVQIGGWISYNLTPKVSEDLHWKQVVGFGFSVPIYKKISLWIQCNWYPFKDQESSGDPDFIYGFGYYDWSGGGFILSYSNYAANSYPWSKDKGGRFMDGSITFGYNIDLHSICDRIFGKRRRKPKPSQTRFPWGPTRIIWEQW